MSAIVRRLPGANSTRPPGWIGEGDRGDRGQALVEFALAIVVFLMIVMAVIDLGRGIYMWNGVAQAAREIARVTSVHPGTDPTQPGGRSAEMTRVIGIQKGLVPGLQDPVITCVDVAGDPVTGTCRQDDLIRVHIEAPYRAVTPIFGQISWPNLGSTSSVAIQ